MSVVDSIRERQGRDRPRASWRPRTDYAAPPAFDADDVEYMVGEIAAAKCADPVDVMLADAATAEVRADVAEDLGGSRSQSDFYRDYARMVRLACRIAAWDNYIADAERPRQPGHLPQRPDAATIKAQIDLPSFIDGKYVRLVKAGRDRFVGLCPFHGEKSPSMSVWSDGRWHCFGCGAGGDVFEFVKRWYKCDFRGALEILRGGT